LTSATEGGDGGARGRASRVRALAALPCALLVAGACHQLVLARTAGLSPWSGGGFGMFSTTDAGATRHLHVFVLRPGLRREIDPSRLAPEALRRTLTLPSERNLRAIARAAAALPAPDHGAVMGVEVQVWHTRYEAETLSPESRILASLTFSPADD
jgi:hypothetical protein